MPDGWRIERHPALDLVRCEALDGIPGLAHGFSTRRGRDGADLDADRAEDRQALARAAGLGQSTPVMLHQVHGTELVPLSQVGPGTEADGVLAARSEDPTRVAAVRVADCVPVLIAHRQGQQVAAVHAGWRGTAQGIIGHAIRRLVASGLAPADLVIALGPAIGPCCYEVGPEVARAVAGAGGEEPDGSGRAHLHRSNRLQAAAAGVPGGQIHQAPWCTRCEGGLFFSYRRQGAAAGRMMACVGWSGAP